MSYIDFGEILLFNIFKDASGKKLKRTLSNKRNVLILKVCNSSSLAKWANQIGKVPDQS